MPSSFDPSDAADGAAEAAGVSVRPLRELGDADRVSSLIGLVWGDQTLPRELIRAFQHAGTVLLGAERGDELVGFVFGFLGFEQGLHLHSHMLAVVPEHRSRGTGYALKLAQRAACLDLGIEEVRWTFDPLVARNARINLVKLGAVATRFLPGFYGEMRDQLNRGDLSDRFEVRWRLESKRVEAAVRGEATEPATGARLLEATGDPDASRPSETGLRPSPGALVQIPTDHLAIRRSDSDLGRVWREASGRAFAGCFSAGLVATWLTEDGSYVFERVEDAG